MLIAFVHNSKNPYMFCYIFLSQIYLAPIGVLYSRRKRAPEVLQTSLAIIAIIFFGCIYINLFQDDSHIVITKN